jgi:hypothetical protein
MRGRNATGLRANLPDGYLTRLSTAPLRKRLEAWYSSSVI